MNRLKKITKSKERKSLVENLSYLSLLQLANYVFPLITLPYLSRTIGVYGFGKLAFAGAVMLWFRTVVDWGFNFTATKEVVRVRDDARKISVIFSDVLWAKILLLSVSFLVLIILIFTIPLFRENALVLALSFLLLPGHIAFPEWFFQAMEKMKYITILNVLSKLVFTIAVFVVIRHESDYYFQPLLSALGYLIAGMIAFFLIVKRWNVRIVKPNIKRVLEMLKSGTSVFINTIIPNIFSSLSVVLLGFWGGVKSTGLFDAGNKFITIGHQVTNILSRTFFPVLARKIDKHGMYTHICLSVALVISVLLFLFAPLLINVFFTEEFIGAVIVLRIKAFCVFFVALNRVYGVGYLLLKNRERMMQNVTTICSVIGFVIMLPLVWFFDYIGAALAILISQALIGIVMMIKSKIIQNEENKTANQSCRSICNER